MHAHVFTLMDHCPAALASAAFSMEGIKNANVLPAVECVSYIVLAYKWLMTILLASNNESILYLEAIKNANVLRAAEWALSGGKVAGLIWIRFAFFSGAR